MTTLPREFAINYYAQAQYFLNAAFLASQHARDKKDQVAYNNFEVVIVGTNHSFAAELMLKAIIVFHSGSFTRQHGLNNLISHENCNQIKNKLLSIFDSSKHTSYDQDTFEKDLSYYIKNLNIEDKYDKKEIDFINQVKSKYTFNSFDYFLQMHSNLFVKMRYACEKMPPPLDITFTSFITQNLKIELDKLLKLQLTKPKLH